MIATIARYSLREARGNRLLGLAAILLGATFLLAEFVGAVAITEHRAVQASVAGTMLRLGGVFILALFVVTSLLREQEERSLELVLALERPRGHYVLGKLAAHLVLAVALAGLCAATMVLYAAPARAMIWGISLACELWLVAGLGLLLTFTLRQPVAALAALGGIYLLCRSMAALLLLVREPVFARGGAFDTVMGAFIEGLAWVLPALYRFTDSAWLAFGGTWRDLAPVLGQTAVYLPLLAAAAAFDLYRREL